MNNAEKFKQLFGIYATELWAMPGKDFLEWLNEKAQLSQEGSTKDATSDTISRQAAIDTLDCINGAEEVLRSLPPAQPERTCVNCGRTVNNGGWYADGRTRCPIEEHYALPKDGYCHLWEKRNVTDDNYPERQEK